MALLDYLRGPKHKAEADLLRLELVALQTRYTTLEEVARELSVLDLIATKKLKFRGKKLAALLSKPASHWKRKIFNVCNSNYGC